MQKLHITRRLFLFKFIAALMLIGLVLAQPSLATAAPLAEPSTGRTLYVNANTGSDNNSGLSASNAFRTLNYAMDRTRPGDTVLVMNGTYIEEDTSRATLRITERQGGTADNWITYKAYPGHSPRIQSNGHWFAIDIRAPYIIIDGFEIRGTKDQVSFGEAEGAYEDFKRTGLYNQRVHGHGVLTHSYTIIRNNEVHNFGSTGIEIEKVDNVIVENNTVYNTSSYSPNGTSGISVIYPINNGDLDRGLEGTKYKIIIRGNTVYDNENLFRCSCYDYRAITDGNGIIVDLAGDYQGWTLVANNVVFNNGGHGIHTYRTRNVDIINNTLYKNVRTDSDSIKGDLIVSVTDNVNVVNNIVYLRRGNKMTASYGGSNIRYKNNIYYDETNSPDIDSPIDSTNIIANPRFRNPSVNPNEADFRLSSNSPGIDNATDEFLPATDIRGAPRYNGSGDRGAYEDTPAPLPASTNLGDVNCNGIIDSVDALSMMQYAVGLRSDSGGCPLNSIASELNLAMGDVNSSGSITAVDALLTMQCTVSTANVLCPDEEQQDPPNTPIIDTGFTTGTNGFSYQDNVFQNTNQGSYASGSRIDSGAYNGSAGLKVLLGGIDNADINNMSGGWRLDFNVPSTAPVTLSFRYNLTHGSEHESDEYGQVMASVDGTLYGSSGNNYIQRITGNGNGGSDRSSDWQAYSVNLGTLSAGSHSLIIGGFSNQKTYNDEITTILFDDVRISADRLQVSTSTSTPTDANTLVEVQAADAQNNTLIQLYLPYME